MENIIKKYCLENINIRSKKKTDGVLDFIVFRKTKL